MFLQEHCRSWCSQHMLPAHFHEHTLSSSRTLWHVCLHNSSSSWQKDFSSFCKEKEGLTSNTGAKNISCLWSYSWSLRLTQVLRFYNLSRCDHNLLGGWFRVWEVHTGRHKQNNPPKLCIFGICTDQQAWDVNSFPSWVYGVREACAGKHGGSETL